MVFFCPVCWKEINQEGKRCPYCGSDITEHERKGFEEKLINALKHPERETVQRAVWILGRLNSVGAFEPLAKLFEQTDNPFLKVEILDSLNVIKTPDAIDVIIKALDSVESIVRKKAKEIIERKQYMNEKK